MRQEKVGRSEIQSEINFHNFNTCRNPSCRQPSARRWQFPNIILMSDPAGMT